MAIALMRAGQAGRRHLAQPQGDPQPAARDPARGRRAGTSRSAASSGRATRTGRRPRSRAAASSRRPTPTSAADPSFDLVAGTGVGADAGKRSTSTPRSGRSTSSSSTRRASSRSPTCSPPDTAHARSSCSATRTSCLRSRRARIRRTRGARCSSTCSASDVTIPPDRGLFLAETWRLRPELCAFTSDAYYEGRLEPRAGHGACARSPRGNGPRVARGRARGARPVVAPRRPRRSRPRSTGSLGTPFTDEDGETRPLRRADVLVVAPYNAQVRMLRSRLPAAVAVGTVDKFQGQQAPVVFVSMASSTTDEAPRGARLRVRPAPLQRRDLARPVPRRARLRAAAPRRRLQDGRADAARQRRVPVRGARRRRRKRVRLARRRSPGMRIVARIVVRWRRHARPMSRADRVPCGSFPASPGCPAPSAAAARSHRRPPTRCSTARRPGRTSRDEIVSLAVVRLDADGVETAGSRRLVRPSGPIPAEATAVHGIDDAAVAAAPRFADVAEASLALLDGAVFVAHNADFDLPMLAARVRAGRDRLPARRRRVHARRVPAARADRGEPSAGVDLRAARHRARGRARRPRRRARDRGAPADPARRGHRARDRGARPRRVHAPPLPRRHAASVRAADPQGVRHGALGRAGRARRGGRPRRRSSRSSSGSPAAPTSTRSRASRCRTSTTSSSC